MIVLDTNVISEFARAEINAHVQAWINRQPGDALFLTTATIAELRFGLACLPQGRRRNALRQAIDEILETRFTGRILPFDEAAAHIYGEGMARVRAAGKAVSQFDGMIGATALSRGFSIATRDVAPFEALGVDVINPWSAA